MAAQPWDRRVTTQPSFDDIFAVMSAASIGEPARVELPVDADVDHLPTKFALALNVLLDDLAGRAAELAASEGRYRALFADSPLPMWVFDAQTLALLEVNEAAERQYGYTREQLLMMTAKDLRPTEDVAAFVDEMRGPLPGAHASPARHLRRDGTLLDVELHRKAILHRGREAWFVVAIDVTDQIRAEKARAKAERRFARLSESGILGIVIRSVDGRVLEVNEALTRMLGCTREELLSGAVPWSTLTAERWKAGDEAVIAEALRTGVTPIREKEYVRRDGTVVPVLVGAAVIEEDGERGFIAFVLELTDLKRAEVAVQRLQAQLSSVTRSEIRVEATDAPRDVECRGFMNKVLLLVEDNPTDEKLTMRGFKKSGVAGEIVVVRDGAEALDYLFGAGKYADRDANMLPALVLLDLSLPRIDGHEVLRRIRADERTKLMPVVMLTASQEEEDIARSYALGANAYVRKPIDSAEFATVAHSLGLFWLLINRTLLTPKHQ
jgi:two-component system, response regulator